MACLGECGDLPVMALTYQLRFIIPKMTSDAPTPETVTAKLAEPQNPDAADEATADETTADETTAHETTDPASGGAVTVGALLITAGFLANTLQGALGKIAQNAIGPGQFLWLLLLMALAVLLPIELVRRGQDLRAGVEAKVLPFYLLRAVFGLGGFYLFIWAAGLGSLVSANVLLNTTPVFIPVIGAIALNKQVSLRLWGAIALGFIGLLLVVQPSAELLQNPANLIGLGAGLSAAIEFLVVRFLNQTQTPLGQTLYYLLIGSVLTAPAALWQWQPLEIQTLGIILAATAAFLSFQLLLVKAYTYAEPHQIGMFQYSSVIFGAIIGWLAFNEVPNGVAVAGMGLIMVGGALAIYLEQKPSGENPLDNKTETGESAAAKA